MTMLEATPEQVGERIAELRRAAQLSRADLARRLRTADAGTVSLWERGEGLPDAMTVKRLAVRFRVQPHFLTHREDYAAVLVRLRGA